MKRLFATELVGKTATGSDGGIIGVIDDMIMNSTNGRIEDMLITPVEDLPTGAFKMDTAGRVIIPFERLRSVKDVVVMDESEG